MPSEQSKGIVTPEAVVLDFETAGVGSRASAAMIDGFIKIAGTIVVVLTLGFLGSSGGASWIGVVLSLFGIFGFTFLYPTLFETFWNGKTPGKAAMGLQVVTVEGGPIQFRHAAVRGALSVIEINGSFGGIAILFVFFSQRNQRLGDILAGTLVLRQRSGSATPQATAFVPVPGSEEYVSTLDASTLTNEEYQTVRSFLLRSASMQADARNKLADQLGNHLVSRLRTQPPSSMTAEAFLIGVAAAYQRRFHR